MLVRLFWSLGLLFVMATSATAREPGIDLRWTARDGTVLAERTLTLAEIDALPQADLATHTPWTQDRHRFSGPTLAALARLHGATVREARLRALNDYEITVPAEDWEAFSLILASRRDGKPMAIRDKGPFWLVYPLDDHPELNNQFYHARMIWQVDQIDFRCD